MTTTLEIAEQLADEVYGLHCDIGRLEVENAKLREVMSVKAGERVPEVVEKLEEPRTK